MGAINYILLVNLFLNTGMKATGILLALFLLDFGASPVVVGLLATTLALCPTLLAVPVGLLADRKGSRLPLLVGSSLCIAGMTIPWLFPGMPGIFAAAIITGSGISTFNVSIQNLIGMLSTPGNRVRNFSNLTLVNSLASFIGPVVAGFSIDHIGHAPTCLVVSATFLPPLLMLAFRRISAQAAARPKRGEAKGRFMDLLSGPGIGLTLATASLQNIGDTLFSFYMPVYCRSIGLSASTIGMVLGANAAAAFSVRIFLPRMIETLGESRLLLYAFLLAAAGLLFMPLTENALLLGALSFVFGFGIGSTGPVITMRMFANSPPGRSGEALGLKVTVNNLTKVVCPVVLGSVAAALGLGAAFWLTAGLLGFTGWLNQKSGPRKNAA